LQAPRHAASRETTAGEPMFAKRIRDVRTNDGHAVEVVIRPISTKYEAVIRLDGGEMYWDGDVSSMTFDSPAEAKEAAEHFLWSVGVKHDRRKR
jgi:hypothetical protein